MVLTDVEIKSWVLNVRDQNKTEYKCGWVQDKTKTSGLKTGLNNTHCVYGFLLLTWFLSGKTLQVFQLKNKKA